VDLNLPLDFADGDLAELWQAISSASREIGMAIVTGHTGRYPGCAFPMVGGGTAIGVGMLDRYVSASMARVGDAVLVTKGAAIEATGMFGATFPRHLRNVLGAEPALEAGKMFREMSVVRDARVAVSAGVRDQGVTAMHDATEGGVQGALVEIAQASGLGIAIDREAIPVRPTTAALCRLLDFDPFSASSEGTLVLTCVSGKVGKVVARLQAEGIAAAIVGEMLPASDGMTISEAGRTRELVAPPCDPFWPAYELALRDWDRS
jgi:hydrogenase maturation factor